MIPPFRKQIMFFFVCSPSWLCCFAIVYCSAVFGAIVFCREIFYPPGLFSLRSANIAVEVCNSLPAIGRAYGACGVSDFPSSGLPIVVVVSLSLS